MHPLIYQRFREIVAQRASAWRVLEIGAVPNHSSLLAMPELSGCERIGVSLIAGQFRGFRILEMNANDMRGLDADNFDAVLSNATLEHDPRFWLTCAEIRRVLKPGGWAVIGVPGFAKQGNFVARHLPQTERDDHDYRHATLTFRYHAAPADFYRFSEDAVREVLFSGYENVSVESVMMPPRLIGIGQKPTRPAHIARIDQT